MDVTLGIKFMYFIYWVVIGLMIRKIYKLEKTIERMRNNLKEHEKFTKYY